MIRKQVLKELTMIEERKKTRIDRVEAAAKRRAALEAEDEMEETVGMNKSGMSP